jgi:hypothetical protein
MKQFYQIKNLYPFLKHPEKYKGVSKTITMRSGWEISFAMKFLDANPLVLEWSSEDVCIPYFHPVDHKIHRYFVDFWMKTDKKEYLIEIKPFKQTKVDRNPKRITNKYINEVKTVAVNQSKWAAAIQYCEALNKQGKNISFEVITEKDYDF